MNKMITTTNHFEGYRIVEYCGIVSAESALPAKIKGDLSENHADARLKLADNLLAHIPAEANAIVGLKMNHMHQGTMDWCYFLGTAVYVEPLEE